MNGGRERIAHVMKTSGRVRDGAVWIRLTCKARLPQTLHPLNPQGEDPTGLGLARLGITRRAGTDAGDVERLEARATEGDLGRPLHRHLDDPVDPARGREPDELPAAHARHPVAAVGIDGTAVGP